MRQRSSGGLKKRIDFPAVNSPLRSSYILPWSSLCLSRHYVRAVSPLYNKLLEIYARSVSLGLHITGRPIIFNYPDRARVPAHNFLAHHFRFEPVEEPKSQSRRLTPRSVRTLSNNNYCHGRRLALIFLLTVPQRPISRFEYIRYSNFPLVKLLQGI